MSSLRTTSAIDSSSLIELFLATPIESALVSVVPLLLAVAQLANSYLNGLSPVVSIGFAAGMVAFAVVATGHHRAAYRRRYLERQCQSPR